MNIPRLHRETLNSFQMMNLEDFLVGARMGNQFTISGVCFNHVLGIKIKDNYNRK